MCPERQEKTTRECQSGRGFPRALSTPQAAAESAALDRSVCVRWR